MKKTLLTFAIFVFALAVVSTVDAKNDKKYAPPSEEAAESGIYDVKGRPDLKLRVFVYHGKPAEKPGKPVPSQPELACDLAVIADPESDAPVGNFGVTLPAEWEYNLNPDSVPAPVGSENLEEIAQNSLDEWKSAMGNSVTFVKGGDTSVTRARLDGQNIVSWGRTSASALAVSYLWYYPVTGVMAEVDTIMNQKYAWEWSDPNGWPTGEVCAYVGVYDAQNILTHEFGHTVGLNDHYTDEYADNTMYGYGSKTETKKNTLTTGDKAGVNVIYP